MHNPFLPMNGVASLNAVTLADLPGVLPDPDVRGCNGFELLAARSVSALVRTEAGALGLPPDAPDLLPRFDRCFAAADPAVRARAEAIARIVGRRLGYVLLALRRGDAINRAARADWDDRHWAWWAAVRRVWLGGGIVSGALGERLPDHARDVLAENGVRDLGVCRSPYGAALPRVGAARTLGVEAGSALVFDCGGSFFKRALARYEGRALFALHDLPPVPAPADVYTGTSMAFAARLAGDLADFIAATWLEAAAAGEHLAPALGLVLAAYVHGGRFFPRHAWGYYALRYLADDFAAYLAGLVSDQIAQRVVIHLWHDGTAAALVYAPSARAVVIQLGTALGVGFAPESDAGLCPLGPGFVVT